MTSATNGDPSESTPLLATAISNDPLLSVLPSSTLVERNHPTSQNLTAAKRDLRRLTRANRAHVNGTDTSESSAYSNDNSLGSHVRRINSSFRQLSSRLIEYVAHHTGMQIFRRIQFCCCQLPTDSHSRFLQRFDWNVGIHGHCDQFFDWTGDAQFTCHFCTIWYHTHHCHFDFCLPTLGEMQSAHGQYHQ